MMKWHVPHEMTIPEIEATVAAFAYGAAKAKEAGLDGCTIHGSHGYLVAEFLSPYFNRRSDEYGGSFENRMRFPLEVIEAVRDEVGPDFVVGIRVNADDFVDGGTTLDDFLKIAPLLVEDGRIDFVNVSVGTYISTATVIDPMYLPLNSFVYCAAAVKQVVDVPVIARGRITDPVQAEEILANNQADMVSMVRAIIADPDLANKASQGRAAEIRKCIGCNEGCWRRATTDLFIGMSQGISCTMNQSIGREGQFGWLEPHPAEVVKRVLVVGGGPAGLEAARVAAVRGHKVVLYDRGAELGGQTLIAAKAPGRDGFLDLGRYYSRQMVLLGVDTRLNSEVTIETVESVEPDAIVIATGSTPLTPEIPGMDGAMVVEMRDVLDGKIETGKKVVVVATDDDIQGLSVADFLAEQRKEVEVIVHSDDFGTRIEPCTRQAILHRLARGDVALTNNSEVTEVSNGTVSVRNVVTQQTRTIEDVDSVVIAFGGREERTLYDLLGDRVPEIHVIGDANGVRRINDATHDGAVVGRAL
jgi:NADPH-dependent 2,4-dienoyl-CoA reductase/sulfur reductase-like enzyme